MTNKLKIGIAVGAVAVGAFAWWWTSRPNALAPDAAGPLYGPPTPKGTRSATAPRPVPSKKPKPSTVALTPEEPFTQLQYESAAALGTPAETEAEASQRLREDLAYLGIGG